MKATEMDHHRELNTLSDYYSDNEQPNDLDFNEMAQIAKYRECIAKLERKCEWMSQNNERMVRRLHYVKRITIRKKRDVALLKGRLDLYSDDWRTAQPDPIRPPPSVPTVKVRKPRVRKNDAAQAAAATAAAATATTPAPPDTPNKTSPKEAKSFKKRKRSKSDKEKDPNAPKRPANPFFQFCQEQRSILMDELNSELQPGEPELSKQELTRQLAQRWRSMDPEMKQIYVDKYESSKQKYNQEMLTYKRDVTTNPLQSTNK